MAFRNQAHREQVFRTPEYRRAVAEFVRMGAPVPLHVFQKTYGEAFYNRNGRAVDPSNSETSRQAFVNLMKWTGKVPREDWDEVEDWDDWNEYNDY